MYRDIELLILNVAAASVELYTFVHRVNCVYFIYIRCGRTGLMRC